jgi:hypothetical protein
MLIFSCWHALVIVRATVKVYMPELNGGNAQKFFKKVKII